MSDQRRKCPGHPNDASTAHFWDALTGLPSDFHEPGSTCEGLAGLELPRAEDSVCPRHAPLRREKRR